MGIVTSLRSLRLRLPEMSRVGRRTACGTTAAVLAAVAATVSPMGASTAGAVQATALREAHYVLAGFGTQGGWRVDRHPRFVTDITGDGRADVVGFGDDGVWTSVATGDGGFTSGRLVLANLGYNQGWRVGVHRRYVVDITGDGHADILGIGAGGVYTAVANGDGSFAPLQLVSTSFTASSPAGPYYMADMNGDDRADIYNISSTGVRVALARSTGSFDQPRLVSTTLYLGRNGFPFDDIHVADVTGDRRAEILAMRTDGSIHLVTASPLSNGTYGPPTRAQLSTSQQLIGEIADITGDGAADIVTFGQTEPGSFAAVSQGNGAFSNYIAASDGFGAGGGWGADTKVVLRDLDGDRRADIIGFGEAGVWTAMATGNGIFAPSRYVLAGFGIQQGWHTDRHPRFVEDITGDGLPDIVGFGDAGVWTSVSS